MSLVFFDIECASVYKTSAKICAFGYVVCDDDFNILEKEDILFILKKDLLSLKDDFNDNDFFIFADVSVNKDFIKKSLLHYQYLSKNFGIRFDEYDKFMFSTTNTLDNVIFNGNLFENVIGQYLNDDLLVDIYLI